MPDEGNHEKHRHHHQDPAADIIKDGWVEVHLLTGIGGIVKQRHSFNDIEVYAESETSLYFRMKPVADDKGKMIVNYPWPAILTYIVQCNSPEVSQEIEVARAHWEMDHLNIVPPGEEHDHG